MILRKYMSLLGIGSAKVDLILEKEEFLPGEGIKGYFLIQGGTIEQQIKRIECDLVLLKGENDLQVIESLTIFTSSVIGCEQDQKIDFFFKLPHDLSPSQSDEEYQFETRLIFDEGVKSVDLDKIQIENPNHIETD